ncbi:hypothetical protein N9C48_00305 [bacterium]|nr:hypothetical protein [bacterium]MDA9938531.1 hypothetical protein [bacterium]
MPAVTDLVNSSVYNSIRSSINNVLGVGDGAQNGYGRTLESESKADNDIIRASDMQLLYNDLVKARTHQSGNPPTWAAADGLGAPSAGEIVGVYAADVGTGGTSVDATTDLNEGFADFESAAIDIIDDRDVFDSGQFSTTIENNNERQSSWNGEITHTVTVTWLNADERRYFFNTGGVIKFNANLTGGTSVPGDVTTTPPGTKDEIWQTMLGTMGTITFGKNTTVADGTNPGIGTNVGNYYEAWAATSATYPIGLFAKSGAGLYAENEYSISAWETAPNSIRFLISFADYDIGDDAGGASSTGPEDEDVTGVTTSTVSFITATGVLAIPKPALTVNSNL